MEQHWSYFYIALVMLAINGYGHALEVKVIPTAAKVAKTRNVEVTLQYNNTGPVTLYIYNWLLPQQTLDDPIFRVTRNGKPVQYTGKLIKRSRPTAADVISVAPGKTIKSLVDVSSAYNMTQSDSYTIEFNMDIERVLFTKTGTPQTKSTSAIDGDEVVLQSAAVTLFVEGRQNVLITESRKTTYTYCSPSQSATLASVLTAATSYANSALTYLKTTKPSATSRYVTWFGTYSLANWNTVKAHFTNIQGALATKAYVFDCSCKRPNVYAYVYPTLPYKVYLCDAFWSASMTGTDSKAGTLVHESSHFSILAGTQDYAYGQTDCKSLAISKPAKAVLNADSHEYFVENNPVLR